LGSEIRRIAILNRAEAATRALRAIRELRAEEGSELVGIALYTEPDATAPFVREADESLSLGPALRASAGGAMRPAYLDHDRVLAALRAMRADAVWPGWGFLAEDPSFVEKLEAAEIAFLGPSANTMRRLGDKITSKLIAEAARVPVSPWSGGPVTRDALPGWVAGIGAPVMLKATAGGGGRGIRMLRDGDDLLAAFDSAESEAANAFGDGTLFVEKAISGARHVEVQMAADRHGTVLALGLRDCSVQRKHQKVVEEGPPPGLSEGLVKQLREASIRLLREASRQALGDRDGGVDVAGEQHGVSLPVAEGAEHGAGRRAGAREDGRRGVEPPLLAAAGSVGEHPPRGAPARASHGRAARDRGGRRPIWPADGAGWAAARMASPRGY